MAGDIASYIFGGTSGTPSYEELVRRRQIATANAMRQKKMPTTLGEGMTYLGEAVGDRLESNRLTEAERAFAAAGKSEADRIYGSGAAATPVVPPRVAVPSSGAVSGSRRVPTERIAPDAAPAGAVPGGGAILNPTLSEGAADPRDKLALALMTSPQEVAQMDPTLGAATPPGSQSDDPIWSARTNAIGGIESSNDYRAVGVPTKYGRAMGRYGVIEANVPKWTAEALGQPLTPQQFLADPQAQDAVFKHRFGQYVAKYGEEKAARAWYGGEGNINNLDATDAHEKLSVHDYGRDYINRLTKAQRRSSTEEPGAAAPIQLAALGGAGGTMTDAPPPGAGARPMSGVEPEPDPTVTGDIRPMSAAPNMMAQVGPEMFSPRRMSDAPVAMGPNPVPLPAAPRAPAVIPGAAVTPGGTTASTAVPAAAPPSADYVMPKPVPPTPPERIPETPREIAARRMLIAQPTNPYVKQAAELAIKEEEDKRTYAQQREISRYNGELTHFSALDTKYQEWLAGKKKRDQDIEQQRLTIDDAREKSVLQARLGGREPEKFFTEFDKQKQVATTQAHVLGQLALARQAINEGVITGTGAGWRIDAAKLQNWMLNNKVSGDLASNTERMQAALNSMLSIGVQNMQGNDPKVSNADIEIARGTVAADPKLQLDTIKRVMSEAERIAREKLNDYEDQRDYYLKGTRAERAYQIPTTPTAPDQRYIDALIKNKDNAEDRAEFDRRFGTGAAALEIARAKRRER